MITVTVNGVEFSVHSWSDFKGYAEFGCPTAWVKILRQEMPNGHDVSGSWLLHPGLSWKQRYQQMFIQVPSFDPNHAILKALGYLDRGSVDYACPQDWYNRQIEINPDFQGAFWFYPHEGEHHLFGQPLFFENLIARLRSEIQQEIDILIDACFTGWKNPAIKALQNGLKEDKNES